MELIDKDALINELHIIPIDLGYREVEDIKAFVENMPTIEAEEVVRCKDCEWWDRKNEHDGWCHCNENDREGCWQADDYCSWGERREDGTD